MTEEQALARRMWEENKELFQTQNKVDLDCFKKMWANVFEVYAGMPQNAYEAARNTNKEMEKAIPVFLDFFKKVESELPKRETQDYIWRQRWWHAFIKCGLNRSVEDAIKCTNELITIAKEEMEKYFNSKEQ